MTAPERLDHIVIRGEDYQFSLTFDDAGTVVNLAGFVVTAEARDVMERLYGRVTGTITAPSTGVVEIKFPKELTIGWNAPLLNITVRAIGATSNTQYVTYGTASVLRSGSSGAANLLISGSLSGIHPVITGGFS